MSDNAPETPSRKCQATTQVELRRSRKEALTIADVDEQQQQRLANILDEYLEHIENGTPMDVESLVRRNPDIAAPLREFLGGFDLLQADLFQLTPDEVQPHRETGRLGDYDIVREIGRGGMGIVYEAQQISLARRVALKVLPFAAMLDKRQIIRFENEARAAARLHHAHIVPVHGVGTDRGVHYYAMQLIDGQSVRDLVDQRREDACGSNDTQTSCTRRQMDQVARWGMQAASALHTAHQCGVVHRDIKPSNLMLDSDGELWIMDFGLASCQTENNVTKVGDVIGTLHYMSPEQARGDSAVADPRSDIYSLGVTLYELLTLQRPFDGDTHSDVIKQIEFGQCKSIRHWNARVPRDLENVIAKAMSPVASERYATASDLEQDLQRFVERRATHAKPPSKVRLVSRWAARNRSLVVSAATALTVICATLLVATVWLATQHASLAEQHGLASRQLARTESTFEEFGLATAERLKHIPGSEPARQALLDDLLQHYQTLLNSSSNNPSLQADRAVTSTKIANVHCQSGDLESAVVAYREAQNDFRELAAFSNDDGHTSQLAKCLSIASVILFKLGRIDDAIADVGEAIELQESLIASNRQVADLSSHQIDLANSYANLATIQIEHAPAAAIASLDAAATMGKQALKTASGDLARNEALQTLSGIYANRSSRSRGANPDDALKYGEIAVKSARLLLESESAGAMSKEMLATNCNNLATLYAEIDQRDKAMELYREATAALRATEFDGKLVMTLSNLAKLQSANDDFADAVDSYRDAIVVQSALLLDSPANLNHLSRLGGLHNNLAFVQQRSGEPTAACVAYESAIKYQRRAFELAPQTVAYRDALSRTYFNASRAELVANRLGRAARVQRARAGLWPSDASQLFSVASNIATIIQRMPNDDSRHVKWKSVAASTLQQAMSVDTDHRLDAKKTAKLARFLEVQSDRSGLAMTAADESRTP